MQHLIIVLAFGVGTCSIGTAEGQYPRPDRASGRKLFISPMGEPFRSDRPERAWFAQADADGNGRLSLAEFRADASRVFQLLDRGADSEIGPDDVDDYELRLVPEVQVVDEPARSPSNGFGRSRGAPDASRAGGPPGGAGGSGGAPGFRFGNGAGTSAKTRTDPRGAARYGYLDLPQPVIAADANHDRGVSVREFDTAAMQRFAILDRNGDGSLTARELARLGTQRRQNSVGSGGRTSTSALNFGTD